MVKYCNAACKKKHKSKHKKQCERRAAELHDGALFKDPPPREDCPICFLPLPDTVQTTFKLCCGKIICDGCTFAVIDGDLERGKRVEEIGLCPFCRLPPVSYERTVERYKKLMEMGNAEAYSLLAGYYAEGTNGLQQDLEKANELYLKAGELGRAEAYYNLANHYYYGRGVDVDKKKAKHFYELAAMGGCVMARYLLGMIEGQAGNVQRAYKHMVVAAKSGHKLSLDKVKEGFKAGLVAKDKYEQALRAYHERHVEAKSEARDKAVEYRERFAARHHG